LRTADATHLATAIATGAQRFITSDSKDFGPPIKEIDITSRPTCPIWRRGSLLSAGRTRR
jgi:hypothetical protein